uniref:Uncharacterized protein n=1 Tax=Utricularia reniformis TaxID=192314 RepID=A0A1Y0B3R2_9LAMI|nr:hypothetical protein AEK19_MT1930 [Utricularia reniformis]ART32095.1 hypothetical protein AEK19_MT1930 [Utricularia reniformis]
MRRARKKAETKAGHNDALTNRSLFFLAGYRPLSSNRSDLNEKGDSLYHFRTPFGPNRIFSRATMLFN